MIQAKGSSAVMAAKRPRQADAPDWRKAALFCTPPWATRTLFEVVLPRLRAGQSAWARPGIRAPAWAT